MADNPPKAPSREILRASLQERIGLRISEAEGKPNGPRVSRIDGLVLTEEEEKKINSACAALDKSASGKAVLKWLEQLTIRQVAGPGIEPHALQHLEGGRYVFGLLLARIELGKKKL